ncbi:MAG TPA: hypothetical protein PKE06_25855, partial [Flavilitoribacter sp.]|nr:hypothetical protein [Flavilitoribacter sp.]
HGGGGGGGFSGGGGGQSDPGGGGGSFVNFGALIQTIEEAPKSNASLDGCLSYQFYKRSTTGPVANCTSTVTVAIQGDEEFVLTPDMVDAGSYDPNDPDADLDLSFCVPFGPETLCDIPQMSFICENIGQTFTGRLLKVSDSVNENYCAFTINVIAGDVGTLTCPDPQTVVLAPVGCTADLQDQTEYNGSFSILKTLTRPTCSDDLTYQIIDPDLNLTSGTGELEQFTFPLGTSTVTYFSSYPDEGGEASGQSCSFTVTVEPFASTPTIHCPDDLTVSIDEGGICDLLVENGSGTRISPFPAFEGPGDLNYHIVGPGDDPTITDGFGPLSDFDFEVGTSTVTYTATCGALQLTSCAFTVTVENDFNAPPSLTCVDTEVNRLVLDISAGADKQLIIDQILVSESDDCGITSREAEFLDMGPIQLEDFNCADVGENLRATVTVYDAQGEFASCDVRITVADNLGVTCPPDVTVVANPGDCSGTVSADLLEAASTYLCNTALDYEISFSEGGSVTSGSGNIPAQVLGAGHTYVAVYTAENSLDATSNCSFNISVVDDEAPVAVCNDIDINLADDPAAAAAAVGEGSTDNCTIANYSLDLDIACENVGLQSIVLTVTDAAGNQAACSALVQLKDSSVPVIGNCPVQVLVGMNEGACNFTVPDLTQSSFILSGLTDACAGEITLTQSPAVGQLVEGESIEVSLYAADEFGNETESPCVVTVTGQDNQGPVALCQNVTIQLDANGNGSTTAAAVNNGSSDACGIQSTVLSKQSFSCGDVGANTVTLTVTDVNGNASTCTATVTVGDNIAPTALCQHVTVQLNASGTGSTTAAAVNNGSSDACGIQSAVLSGQSFSCADIGSNTVTLTITDPNNNTSTCTATVMVEDNVAPTALCQDVTVQLNGGGTGSTTAESVNNGSSDACGVQ